MSKNWRHTPLAGPAVNRRELNRALAAFGLAAVTVPVAVRTPQAAGKTMHFTWAGYDDPAFYTSYIEKHGAAPDFTLFGEEEEALQKLRTGFVPDTAAPCSYSVPRWRDAGVLEPIDTSKLSNYADVIPNLKNIRGMTDDQGTWFVPVDWGNSTVVYRADLVDEKYQTDNSWTILWDERYAGRLGMFDSVDGAVAVAGLVAGFRDAAYSMNDEQLQVAKELLSKQRPLLRFYWTDITAVDQGLASGELVASYAWNSSLKRLKEQGLDVKMMNPKEGILTWVCGLVKIKNGPGDVEAAYDLINAHISPESGKYEIENWGYGHSNIKAYDMVDEKNLTDVGLTKDVNAFLASGVFIESIEAATREKYIAMFDEVKAGY